MTTSVKINCYLSRQQGFHFEKRWYIDDYEPIKLPQGRRQQSEIAVGSSSCDACNHEGGKQGVGEEDELCAQYVFSGGGMLLKSNSQSCCLNLPFAGWCLLDVISCLDLLRERFCISETCASINIALF